MTTADLWAGPDGDEYLARNRHFGADRATFWVDLIERYQIESVLEVGCNCGPNLRHLAALLGPENVSGVDVNDKALGLLRDELPAVDIRAASGTALPYEDQRFDLVFTTGVLIHQQPGDLAIFDDVHIPDVSVAVNTLHEFYRLEYLEVLPNRHYAIGVRR